MEVRGIETRSTGWEFKVLTTTLSSSDVILIKNSKILQKIDKKYGPKEARNQTIGLDIWTNLIFSILSYLLLAPLHIRQDLE